jgi:hypothetical protein
LLVLDADFVPAPDLRRTVGHFADPEVAMVQARWGHNRTRSLLTRLQAMLLDGHFAVEQAGRAAAGAFFNFNGTAGLWRANAVADAGGWHADTLTEELDLSYRAALRGGRFVYAGDVVAPAELPADLGAFKAQQHRWAKAPVRDQLLPAVVRSAGCGGGGSRRCSTSPQPAVPDHVGVLLVGGVLGVGGGPGGSWVAPARRRSRSRCWPGVAAAPAAAPARRGGQVPALVFHRGDGGVARARR